MAIHGAIRKYWDADAATYDNVPIWEVIAPPELAAGNGSCTAPG